MKTCMIGVLVLSLTHPIFSQNEVAFSEGTTKVEGATKAKNEAMTSTKVSERVTAFQQVAAKYDITSEEIYTPKERATYTVDFKVGKNKITNVYNHEGEVIQNKQIFKDIRLPDAIIRRVLNTYPHWSIKKVSCVITSAINTATTTTYKIKIDHGKKTKTLKFIE